MDTVSTHSRIALSDDLYSWERQPGEPDTAWTAFLAWLDLTPAERLDHGIHTVATRTGTRTNVIGRYHTRYRWAERAAAHDQHREHIASLSYADAARQAYDRTGHLLDQWTTKIEQAVTALDPEDLTPGMLIRAIKDIVHSRATHYGTPTERVAVTGSISGSVQHDVTTTIQWERMSQAEIDTEVDRLARAVLRKQALTDEPHADPEGPQPEEESADHSASHSASV